MRALTPELLQSYLDNLIDEDSDIFQLSEQELRWLEYLDYLDTHPQTKARGLSIEYFKQNEGEYLHE